MAASPHVMYFLEDQAQEAFLRPLVERVFSEVCGPGIRPRHDPRSVRHGSRALVELRAFLKELRHELEHGGYPSIPDVILVAIDGNCKGYAQRAKQIWQCSRRDDPFHDRIIAAAPDPHIERWYLADQTALKRAVGLRKVPDLPPYKCERAYYKNALRESLRSEGVGVVRGGAEFAEDIVKEIRDLSVLGKADKGFGDFLANLREAFKKWRKRARF